MARPQKPFDPREREGEWNVTPDKTAYARRQTLALALEHNFVTESMYEKLKAHGYNNAFDFRRFYPEEVTKLPGIGETKKGRFLEWLHFYHIPMRPDYDDEELFMHKLKLGQDKAEDLYPYGWQEEQALEDAKDPLLNGVVKRPPPFVPSKREITDKKLKGGASNFKQFKKEPPLN